MERLREISREGDGAATEAGQLGPGEILISDAIMNNNVCGETGQRRFITKPAGGGARWDTADKTGGCRTNPTCTVDWIATSFGQKYNL